MLYMYQKQERKKETLGLFSCDHVDGKKTIHHDRQGGGHPIGTAQQEETDAVEEQADTIPEIGRLVGGNCLKKTGKEQHAQSKEKGIVDSAAVPIDGA